MTREEFLADLEKFDHGWGGLDWQPDEIADLAMMAVAAERERCAVIAENWGNAPPNPNGRRAALAAAISSGQ